MISWRMKSDWEMKQFRHVVGGEIRRGANGLPRHPKKRETKYRQVEKKKKWSDYCRHLGNVVPIRT